MITIRKLSRLKARTRLRKCALLFHRCREGCDHHYLAGVVEVALATTAELFGSGRLLSFLERLDKTLQTLEGEALAIALEDGYHLILAALGEALADWDLEDESGSLDRSKRRVMERYLVLDRIRSPYNIGSIFRSADSFGIKAIYLVEGSADPTHSRSRRTSGGTIETIDWQILSEEEVVQRIAELGLPVFALESGGESLDKFAFPEAGIAVLGGEEMGVRSTLLGVSDRCLGRVTIPLGGTKGSLNVAVAAAIMMQRWYSR